MGSMWTRKIDEIGFSDVLEFCGQQHRESVRLDYKADFSSGDAAKQAAKLVCAFANTNGGMAIYGVNEDPPKSRLPEATPTGKQLGPDARDRIIQACSAKIFPPLLPEVSEFLPNPREPDHGFIVVRVPAGPEAPYSVDDRRGVYVRAEDKSEPVRATIGEMEYMFERRKTRRARQEERVRLGIDRLIRAMGIRPSGFNQGPTQQYMSVAIGPTIAERPLIERADLLKSKKPVDYREVVAPVLDGAYETSIDGEEGWLKDVYGNTILAVDYSSPDLKRLIEPYRPAMLQNDWLSSRLQDGKLSQIDAVDIMRPIFHAVDAAEQWCAQSEYFGLITLQIEVKGILDAALVAGPEIVAANRTDKEIAFSFDFGSTNFGPSGLDVLQRVASMLFMGWGHRSRFELDAILDYAERKIYDEMPCPKHSNEPRPKRRDLCLICRRELAVESEVVGAAE